MVGGQERRDLEAIGTLRDPVRHRLYRYVADRPQPVGRDEAASAVGIRRGLAAFHLDRLVGAGLLRAEYRRLSGRSGPGAGRPAKLYRRSRRHFSVNVPGRDYQLLAGLLARAVGGDGKAIADDEEVIELGTARETGHALGVRARARLRGVPTPARLRGCVETVLRDVGFAPYQASDDEIRVRNCPFDPLARRYSPVVCGAGVSLAKGIVDGVEATDLGVARQMQPDRCCIVLRGSGADSANR